MDIAKKLHILFNVKPSRTIDTKAFKKMRQQQQELDDAFEYWLDQCKMIFGEVTKIEKTHGLQEAGIDLSLNLLESNFRFGVQIKTNSDVRSKNFSTKVLAQKSQSMKHSLSKYLIGFAADMTDKRQKSKVQFMISELSQQADNYAITLSPEKVLTIYKAYKLNQHPLKHVFMDYSEALTLLSGVTDNLNNRNTSVEIKMIIKNLEKNNILRPRKFELDLAFNKGSKDKLKILDDLKNQPITDDVVKIDKSTVDEFKITDENENLSDDTIKQSERILAWIEKRGRKFLSFQTISPTGQVIQSHDQVVDIHRDGESINFVPKDMQGPLKVGIYVNIPKGMHDLKAGIDVKSSLPIFQTSFDFNFFGFDVKTVLDKLIFLSSLTNATLLRIFIPEVNITTHMTKMSNLPMISKEILSLFRTLSALQDETGCRLFLSDDVILDQNTISTLLLTATYLLHIVETKIIPKPNTSIKIKPTKKLGIAMLRDYKKNLINSNAMLRTNLSQPLLNSNIVIFDAQLDLSHYTPLTKMNEVLRSKEDIEIELQPTMGVTTP